MRFPKQSLTFAAVALGALCSSRAHAQEPQRPEDLDRQLRARYIAQQRPPEVEAPARQFLSQVASDLAPSLDSLKARWPDAYWQEIGQLAVQQTMVGEMSRRDTVRAQAVAQMFGIEAHARALQRQYRSDSLPAHRQAIRTQIETIITRHFEIEDRLRGLEIADIERRLAEVRTETERRRQKRAELVKWAVDDIIRDATRPQ